MKVAVQCRPHRDKHHNWESGWKLQESLHIYQKRRAETAGSEVEDLLALDLTLVKESYIRLRGWYSDA